MAWSLDPDNLDFEGPAAPPPDGEIPNFDNPPNQNALGLAVIITCLTINTLCVLARTYSKIFVSKSVTVEDGFCIATYGCVIGVVWAGFQLHQISGLFVQQYNVRLKYLFDALYVYYVWPLLYIAAMMFGKTAILLEWIRIFVPARTKNKFYWMCWGMITCNSVFYIACIVASQFNCTPVQKNWDRLTPGECRDRSSLDIFPSSFNLVFDILILLLPQRVIWKLHLDTPRKIGVSIVFSMGVLACACAIGRIVVTVNMNYDTNVLHDGIGTYLWGLAEVTCIILVFCVPAIPKALSNTKLAEVAFTPLKSWLSTRSRFRSAKRQESGGIGPHSAHNPSRSFGHTQGPLQSNKSYHRMGENEDGDGILLSETQKRDLQVYNASTTSTATATTNTTNTPGQFGLERSGQHILRTTHVTTNVTPVTDVERGDWPDRQRQWHNQF